MAKNRTMAIKHAKAKKCAMQEIMDNAKCEMCCKLIPKHIYVPDKPYDTSEVFYSMFAIQKRINIIASRYYPIEEFKKDWNNVYMYIVTHTVSETREHFGNLSI